VKPNILLIIADQHRLDALGCAGRFRISTPHIDRLAREGAFFGNAFTPCPVCAPARQSLLSGRAPESYGALWNNDFIPTATVKPDEGYHTAALSRAGYRCALVGKWNASLTHTPADFGFSDHIDGSGYNAMVVGKYPALSYGNGWFGEPSPLLLADSKTHQAAARACELMSQSVSNVQPWFVRVDFTDPHLPCRPSEPFCGMYDPDALEPWDSMGDTLEGKPYIQRQQLRNWGLEGRTWDQWKSTLAMYYGMVSQIDDAVGIMLDSLDRQGLAEDTLVIYTADHGDLCGGHGMLDKHYVLYDDVTRTPLVIRYPRKVAAGLRPDEFVSNCLDLGATIGDLCGVAVKAGHGISLAPLLAGECHPDRSFAVSSSSGQQFGLYSQRSIRTKDWLYVWNMTDIDELYDGNSDPGQKRNVIHDPANADVLAVLRKTLYGELIRRQDPFALSGWLNGHLLEGRKI
jgi:arylsulfatase A-like enzyme